MKELKTVFVPVLIISFVFFTLSSFNTAKEKSYLPIRWEKLGQHKVNFRVDRDGMVVGRIDGFMTKLQVRVKRGPINMHRMIVHFRNGQTEEIELKKNFKAGSESRVIDLPGNRRVITRVVFLYDTKNFSGSKAVVELWGRR